MDLSTKRLLAVAGCVAAAATLRADSSSIVERASAAPAEVWSRILLRWAVPERTPDAAKRAQLIEQAYQQAASAKAAYPLLPAAAAEETEASAAADARRLRLTALELQADAVRAMMRLSPAKAREMALSMPPPAPALSGCKDAWIADLSAYYGLMLELAQRGYPSAERAKGRHLELLVRVASEAQSVPQLQGALALAAQYKGTEEELSAIASALASSLAVAPPDPRALAAASSLATEVERLTAVLNGRGLDASALLAAYRGYLANQKPCAETKAAEQRLREPAPVNEMRQSLAALQGAPLGSAEREELFAAALRRFESWPEAPPAEVRALFHEKALSCRMLLESADSGSQLDRGLNACVRFFRDTPAKNEYPAEWLIRFERLRQPFAPGGVRNTSSAVEAIRRSGDALMNLLLDMGEPL